MSKISIHYSAYKHSNFATIISLSRSYSSLLGCALILLGLACIGADFTSFIVCLMLAALCFAWTIRLGEIAEKAASFNGFKKSVLEKAYKNGLTKKEYNSNKELYDQQIREIYQEAQRQSFMKQYPLLDKKPQSNQTSQQTEKAVPEFFCKYCGKQIDSDSEFCRYCGNQQDKK